MAKKKVKKLNKTEKVTMTKPVKKPIASRKSAKVPRKLVGEKSKAFPVSLKASEAEAIRSFYEGSLTKSVRECFKTAKLVQQLGSGSLEKGQRRILSALEKKNAR